MALVTAAAATAAAYVDAKLHLSHDLKSIRAARHGNKEYEKAASGGTANAWFVFNDTVARFPDMHCLWTREGSWTYRQIRDIAVQCGHFFQSLGVKKGDLVAVYLQNRPEFLFIWLGLWCIGCAPAAINYNLSGDALIHCLKISSARLVIVDDDADCRARIDEVKTPLTTDLGMDLRLVGAIDLTSFPTTITDDAARDMDGSFPAMLLYTSGTTGMPKGCAFTMQRIYHTLQFWQATVTTRNGPDGERWYSCMPLYHGTSAICLIVNLCTGTSIALGKRFSVRNFWPEVRDSRSTTFVYVGEVVRYLLAVPESPDDKNHCVKRMYGNGLRPDVWERFRERFGVEQVCEFFNSTEGVFSLLNMNSGPFTSGSVGHHGFLMRLLLHDTYIPVAIDPNTGDVLRDPKTGFATREPYTRGGEIIVRIPEESAWQGYWKNESATEKKFLRDVFEKGDLFYRSGDALRRSDDGRWYFLDRLGDTFRWKSENVSTAEVAQALGAYPGILEANVYGVQIPHHEGRAGCAAIQLNAAAAAGEGAGPKIDFTHLAQYAREKLPKYAVPVFLRLVRGASHIHNHKQNKVPLREEGVDLDKVGADEVLWLGVNSASPGYVPFERGDWEGIVSGRIAL